MVLTSFFEVISIGAVIPFLSVLTAPEKIYTHELAVFFVQTLQIKEPLDMLLPFTLLFVIAVIFSGLARISLLWAQTQISMNIAADFSVRVYEDALYQPYSLHISQNSSEILAGSQKAKDLVGTLIQPILIILSSILIFFAVMGTLLFIQPAIAISVFLSFAIIYVAVVLITKQRIFKNSKIISVHHGNVSKAIQEGLGNIRDVLIDGTQPIYSRIYQKALIPMQAAQASNQVVGAIPRYGTEALGMVLIATLAYVLATGNGATNGWMVNSIPILGSMALGAQRLLPILQQVYNAYITIKGNQISTQDALNLLYQSSIPKYAHGSPAKPIPFEKTIFLKDIGFRYTPQGPLVLKNLSLEIIKGSRVGFIGITGSGKSTLMDVLMGLLIPTNGELQIDGRVICHRDTRAWQLHISHVPQSIFLADISIAENIAIGVSPEKINLELVKIAADKAQISETIEGWEDQYSTIVGERGVRLSGGQRQRIGIARAIYKRADVIILDEATSALDDKTEATVMQSIENLGSHITVLMIAHRLSTLKKCDRIFELEKGRIKSIGTYEQMITKRS